MDITQAGQDLHFVREALAKRQAVTFRSPPALYYWAAYVLVGYTAIDFAPRFAGWFFLVGTIAGVLLSGLFARRFFSRQGEVDAAQRSRHLLHWLGGMILAIGVPIALANLYPAFRGTGAGQVSAIMVGLVYFTAGIHIDRAFLWMGLLLIAGGVLVGLIPGYGWTVLGVLLAAALVATAMSGCQARPIGADKANRPAVDAASAG